MNHLEDSELNLKIGMLRQWLNEDRITDPQKMVTNEDIHQWLDSGIEALLERENTKVRIEGMEQAKSRVLRRTEIPKDAKEPTRDIVVVTGEECARIIDLDIAQLNQQLINGGKSNG